MKEATPYRLIPLTKGLFARVSPEDFEELSKHKWQASQESRNGLKVYAVRWARKHERVDGRKTFKIRMHRVVLGLPPGIFDNTFIGDHLDGDGLNNTRENLRIVTQEENMARANFGYLRARSEEPSL